MSSAATDLPQSIGRYEILEFRDRTSRTKIYKGKDPETGDFVTIEIANFDADPETSERFRKEAEKLKALSHPNLPKILEVGSEGTKVFVASEFNGLETLESYLKSNRPSLRDSIMLTRAVARATEAAHAQDITHLQLTPKHIRVSSDLGTVKVRGFLFGESTSKSRNTEATVTLTHDAGQIFYLAPEQDSGDDLGTWTDVYGIGVILYETLTGNLPIGSFALPSRNSSTIPPEIDPIVLRCLAKRPSERYRTVGALGADLDKLADRMRLHLAQDLEGLGKQTSELLSNKGLLAGLAAVALAAVAGAFFLLRGGGDGTPTQTAMAAAPVEAAGPSAAADENSGPGTDTTTRGAGDGSQDTSEDLSDTGATSGGDDQEAETDSQGASGETPAASTQRSESAVAKPEPDPPPSRTTPATATPSNAGTPTPVAPATPEPAAESSTPARTESPATEPAGDRSAEPSRDLPDQIGESGGIYTDSESLISWYGPRMIQTSKDAEEYVENMSRAGLDDWRTPSNVEMQQICTAVNADPRVNLPRYVWTSDRRGTPLRRKNALYDCRGNHVEGYFNNSEARDKVSAGLRPYALPIRDAR